MRLVTAAIIISDGTVLIARRKAGDTRGGYWEFPGGVVEPGETLHECLERELREELGITATIGEPVAETVYRDEHGHLRLVALEARIAGGELTLAAHDRVEWVVPGDLARYRLSPADVPIAKILAERTNLFEK
jgi:8-oxo-dGTP diphosphatase